MKIIRPGREQVGWAKKFSCTGKGNGVGGCNALLLVEQADVFLTHKYDYGGGHDTFQTFRCPCGVLTDFTNTLPFTPRQNEKDPTP